MKGQVKATFYLTILTVLPQHRIRDHIIRGTEEKAFRILGTKCELDTTKLNVFIALLCARGAYRSKNLDISYLWNKIWAAVFFFKNNEQE